MTTPTLNKIVTEMARYVTASGFDVDWNTSMPWVAILDEQGNVAVYLQNDDAEHFIAETFQVAEDSYVHLETSMLAQAKPYIDCL